MCLMITFVLLTLQNRIFAQHDTIPTINIDINVNVENSEFQDRSVKMIGEQKSLGTSGRNFNKVSRVRNDLYIG